MTERNLQHLIAVFSGLPHVLSFAIPLVHKLFKVGTYYLLPLAYGDPLNSSDGRVVRAPTSEAVDLGLIPSQVKPMTWYSSQLPCLTLSLKGAVWRTSRQLY